jgi:hypothetical protein
MAEDVAPGVLIAEKALRDLAKNATKVLSDLEEKEPAAGVK